MKPIWLLLVAIALVAVAAVWFAQSGDEAIPTTTDQTLESQTEVQGPGMRAHIDQETGKFVETPPTDDALEAVGSTPEVELVEEPLPGGGVMINLQGKFRQTSVATVDEADSVNVECLGEEQASKGGN